MGQTSRYGFRYPEASDDANVPQDMKKLAEDVEAVITDSTQIKTLSGSDLDCNNYTDRGIYFFNSIPANGPGFYGWMEVFSSEILTKQIWHRSATITGSNEYQTFVRLRNRGNWSAWERYSMEQDAYYKAGDSFTEWIKAVVRANANDFRFQIPLSKPVKSGATATVQLITRCDLFQGSSVISALNNISTINAYIYTNVIEVVCTISTKPTGYVANVVTSVDTKCTVTFA